MTAERVRCSAWLGVAGVVIGALRKRLCCGRPSELTIKLPVVLDERDESAANLGIVLLAVELKSIGVENLVRGRFANVGPRDSLFGDADCSELGWAAVLVAKAVIHDALQFRIAIRPKKPVGSTIGRKDGVDEVLGAELETSLSVNDDPQAVVLIVSYEVDGECIWHSARSQDARSEA